MNFLQKYIFIPLDIFRESQHNKDIDKRFNIRRNAWLTLFSNDEPETVIKLAEKYPEFRKIYEECYEICASHKLDGESVQKYL